MTQVSTRSATPQDVDAIHAMITELAVFEREPDAVEGDADQLRQALFGPAPQVFCEIAEVGSQVAGMALWFVTFSTWKVRHGMWLEDLFVRPEHRRQGVGQALLQRLQGICEEREYGRLEWTVLDWNTKAQAFYAQQGATSMDEWTTWRVETRPRP